MAHAHHHEFAAHTSTDPEYASTPPGSGHEHTDANVWLIVKFGVWLFVSAVIIHVGLGFMFALLVKQAEEQTQEFPLATGQEQRLPASPRLQQFPVNEYYDYRLREDSVLHKYGWVNKDAGVVRMPIEDAMRVAVERGLPARAQQPAAAPSQPAVQGQTENTPTQGTPTLGLMPADSSSGRTMERRRQ